MSMESQMAHAAWDAATPYDIEDEARRNPFLAAHMARRDAELVKSDDEKGGAEHHCTEWQFPCDARQWP